MWVGVRSDEFESNVLLAVLKLFMLFDDIITDEHNSANVDAVLSDPYGFSVLVSLKRTNFGVLNNNVNLINLSFI